MAATAGIILLSLVRSHFHLFTSRLIAIASSHSLKDSQQAYSNQRAPHPRNIELFFFDYRLTRQRKIHRIGNEAELMRFLVQLHGEFFVGAVAQAHLRLEHHFSETPAAVFSFNHCSTRLVDVIRHNDAGIRAQVQLPKHVTCGQSCDQSSFGL